MRSPLAVLTLTAGVLLPAAVASASTVDVENGVAVFRAGNHASNVTSATAGLFPPAFSFADSLQTMTAGAGCAAGAPFVCVADSEDVQLSLKNDTFAGHSSFPISVEGNGGADSIRAAGGDNVVSGGSGADRIWANGESSSKVSGDAGNDDIYAFENGAAISAGDGDDLAVLAAGSPGAKLDGGAGYDQLVSSGAPRQTITGGDNPDTIVADSSADTIDGGAAADTIETTAGGNTITGGLGNDTISSVDDSGSPDSIDCGSGTDTVYADASDVVAANCERVHIVATAPTLPAADAARTAAAAFVAAMP